MSEKNTKETYRKLIEKFGFDETKNILDISTTKLVELSNIQIDPKIAYEILYELVSEKKIPTKYKDFRIVVEEDINDAIRWESVTKFSHGGKKYDEFSEFYTSPFWNNQPLLLISHNFYIIQDKQTADEEFVDDYFGTSIEIKTPYMFEDMEELLVWYRDFYLPVTYDVVTDERDIRREKSGFF